MILQVNGVDLFYARGGVDAPRAAEALPVICLCGALGTTENDFGPQLAETGLAANREVIDRA